jgi:hypothetical protein
MELAHGSTLAPALHCARNARKRRTGAPAALEPGHAALRRAPARPPNARVARLAPMLARTSPVHRGPPEHVAAVSEITLPAGADAKKMSFTPKKRPNSEILRFTSVRGPN